MCCCRFNITSLRRAFGVRGYRDKDTIAERCQQSITEKTGIRPDAVIMLEGGTLPRTSSGKLRRKANTDRNKKRSRPKNNIFDCRSTHQERTYLNEEIIYA